MSGPFRCAVIAGLVVAGCGDESTPQAGDAAVGGGLVLAWDAQPTTWPGDVGRGVTIERATFAVDSVRIVGDAAPGDPRTTASALELQWDQAGTPAAVVFPDAPGGVYSQLSLRIDGLVAGPSLSIGGRVVRDDGDYAFTIVEDSPVSVTLALDASLAPPAPLTVVVRIDFEHVLDAIDFAAIDDSGGTLEIASDDPQMATVRTKLVESFSIAD